MLGLVLIATAPLAAQVTSPRGFDTIEGNNLFLHWAAPRRFQQLDQSNAGTPMVVSAIAWRRDGSVVQSAPAHVFDLQVDMGHGDFGAIHQKLDENFRPGSRTTVFNQVRVAFPDWSANLGAPAPFDFRIQLTSPFAYHGNDALVIDFSYANSTATSVIQTDREFNGTFAPSQGSRLGTGCVASGMASPFTHVAYMANNDVVPVPAYGMRFGLAGSNAPAGAPVLLFLDYQDRGLSGLLCSTLHCLPVVSLTLSADATGLLPNLDLGFAHDASLAGASVYSQLLAIDLGQSPIPLVVSNGEQTSMPAVATPAVHRCAYGWYNLPNATGLAISPPFVGGGMVMLLQ